MIFLKLCVNYILNYCGHSLLVCSAYLWQEFHLWGVTTNQIFCSLWWQFQWQGLCVFSRSARSSLYSIFSGSKVSAQGPDTERDWCMSCVCVWNPSSREIVFPHWWSFDQWQCGLYGFVLPPWHCTLPAGLTELPVSLECPRRDHLALGFLDCLHKRSLVTAT